MQIKVCKHPLNGIIVLRSLYDITHQRSVVLTVKIMNNEQAFCYSSENVHELPTIVHCLSDTGVMSFQVSFHS
jgi:hypothetical protein